MKERKKLLKKEYLKKFVEKKTKQAYSENKFKDELIKLQIRDGDTNFTFEKDEHPRANLNLDDLRKLKTAFKEKGTVTPGNSSGLNDGAAALALMSRDQAYKKSLDPFLIFLKSLLFLTI